MRKVKSKDKGKGVEWGKQWGHNQLWKENCVGLYMERHKIEDIIFFFFKGQLDNMKRGQIGYKKHRDRDW